MNTRLLTLASLAAILFGCGAQAATSDARRKSPTTIAKKVTAKAATAARAGKQTVRDKRTARGGATRGARSALRRGREKIGRVAPEAAIQGQLAKLAPETRIEQRCNARAMNALQTEHKDMRPDRLVAYAFGDPEIKNGFLKADGAAVRSSGSWFRLTYECQTADEGMSVKSFAFTLGALVPRKDWDDHYLVP